MQTVTIVKFHDSIMKGIGHKVSSGQIITGKVSGKYDPEQTYKIQLDNLADAELLQTPCYPDIEEYNALPINGGPPLWTGKELIAGSSIANLINSAIPTSDVDVYFKSKADAMEFLDFNKVKLDILPDARCVWVSFSGLIDYNIIWHVPWNDPQELLAGFDIRACALAYDPHAGKMYAVPGAIGDIVERRIVYQTHCRAITTNRLLKYISKGFNIDKYQRCIFSELLKSGKHSMELEMYGGYGDNR